MRNLAIECSGIAAAVGLFDKDRPLRTMRLSRDVGSVCALAPAITEILGTEETKRVHQPCQGISVTVGPGSFTGLRVGLATSKLLAMAWNVPIAPVDTLQAIVHRQRAAMPAQPSRKAYIIPVLNAFRRQVFTALWELDEAGQLVCRRKSFVCDAAPWIEDPRAAAGSGLPGCGQPGFRTSMSARNDTLSADGSITWVAGPGLETYQPKPALNLQLASEQFWYPEVSDVAAIGREKFEKHAVCTATELLPNYIRASAAEEKAKLKEPSSCAAKHSRDAD